MRDGGENTDVLADVAVMLEPRASSVDSVAPDTGAYVSEQHHTNWSTPSVPHQTITVAL